jgi:hypothetical protein
MRLDNLQEPITLWYTLEDGTKVVVPPELCEFPNGWRYQYCKYPTVVESICTSSKQPKWPIRFFKWIMSRMPDSWKGNVSQVARGETGINCLYPVIKYLVEQRKWSFHDSCVAASNLCERCMNICLWECDNDQTAHQQYLSNSTTICDSCKHIDPDYYEQKRVKHCYKTMAKQGNVALAYKNIRTYKKGDQEW